MLRHWTINDLLVFERRETLRHWTINDLLGWSTKAGLLFHVSSIAMRKLDIALVKAANLCVDFMLLNGPCQLIKAKRVVSGIGP